MVRISDYLYQVDAMSQLQDASRQKVKSASGLRSLRLVYSIIENLVLWARSEVLGSAMG